MFWTYRSIYLRTKRPLTWALLGLRAAGLLALVLALAKPTWTNQTDLIDAGRVAVVLDNSISMSLEGRYAQATKAVEQLRDQIQADDSGPEKDDHRAA